MTNTSTGEAMTFVEALCAAQRDAMAEDDTIVLLGQDIVAGFPFGATRDLAAEFGTDRVINTPISEAGTMGCGVGAAMAGLRPVVEVDFAGFLYLGFDQLLNNAAKIRYMSNGQVRVPLVVRVGQGPLGSFAAQHSQSLHAMLASVPGLSVLAPSDAQSAYECMRWALRQNDPVVICEDLRIYKTPGVVQRTVPTSISARTLRQGDDITLFCYGAGTLAALAAAQQLSEVGIESTVVDLVSFAPLDLQAIATASRKTGRVVVVADDNVYFGVGATIAAIATAEAWDVLGGPVSILASKPVPVPYASSLEQQIYPSIESIVATSLRLVEETHDA